MTDPEARGISASDRSAGRHSVASPDDPLDWSAFDRWPPGRTRRDRALGAVVGLAVGDALGATLQFADRDSLPPVADLVGGGPFELEPGEWTAPTSMALCLGDSIEHMRLLNNWDVMERFMRCWKEGHNTASGTCRNISDTLRWTLGRFSQMWPLARYYTEDAIGNSHESRATDNGSLVRVAPVAVFWHGHQKEAETAARQQSRTTHSAPEAVDACAYYSRMLVEAISGSSVEHILRSRRFGKVRRVAEVAAGSWRRKTREEIKSDDCVIHTLEASLWSIFRAVSYLSLNPDACVSSYREVVLTAVNLGGDSTSVGAVTGQLAGALWGLSGIPTEWVEQIAQRERIVELAEDLYDPRVSMTSRASGRKC